MRLKTITFLCILVNILVSCEGYDIDKNNTVTKSFLGDIIVTNSDGTTFIDQDIRITFTKSLNNDGYDIFLKKVKFAEKMPFV